MKNIFELYENEYLEDITDDRIKFFSRLENIKTDDILTLINLMGTVDTIESTEEVALLELGELLKVESKELYNEILDEFRESYYDEEIDEYFNSFKDIIDSGYTLELLEIIDDDVPYVKALALANGLRIREVYGYSQGDFAYTLAPMDFDEKYIEDMYTGYGWYYIEQYTETGEFKDGLGSVYAPNEVELIEQIKEHFEVDENEKIYFVDNYMTNYLEVPKVNKMVKEYEFSIIE